MNLQHIDELASELNSGKEARKVLAAADIPLVEGFFDRDRLDAYRALPSDYKTRKHGWDLAPTHGIGLIKRCMEEAEFKITAHYLRGANHFDFLDHRKELFHTKMYYTNLTQRDNTAATFTLTNFVDQEHFQAYSACAMRIPALWMIYHDELCRLWNHLSKKGPGVRVERKKTRFWIDRKGAAHPNGQIHVQFSVEDTEHLVSAPGL